jgi:DNA-binding IclR family transcriptional regulator
MTETAFTISERPLSGVSHALDILELLGQTRAAMPLSGIARDLGMSKAGAHRMLSTLAGRGYVDRLPSGQYRLALKAWELGCSVPELEIVKVAAPIMERVAVSTGDSCFLVVLSGFYAINLHSVAPNDQPVRLYVELGSRLPANCTGAGLALLAELDDAELTRILPAQLVASSAETIIDKNRLLRELAQIRARGYAINLGGWRTDVGGIAAAIRESSGKAVAALNVAGPRYRVNRGRLKSMAGTVLQAAREISAKLSSGRSVSLKRVV